MLETWLLENNSNLCMFFCDRYKLSKHTATLGLLVSNRLGEGRGGGNWNFYTYIGLLDEKHLKIGFSVYQ
jgi:hypothetical protein